MRRPSWRHFERKRYYFAALASELASPFLRVPPGPVTPPRDWKRILVLGDHHLGDALYRSASFDACRAWLPDAEWTLLSTESVRPLLDGVSGWRVLSGYNSERRDLVEDEAALQAMNFDAAICSSPWRIHQDLKLAIKLDIPNRAAPANKGFSKWVTHCVEPVETPMPYVMKVWDLLRQATGQDALDVPITMSPRIVQARSDKRDNRLAIFTTSRQPVEQWPESSFAEVARCMREKGWDVVLLGAASDRERLERIAGEAGGGIRVSAGEFDLAGLASFLSTCRLVLATDSGPRHVANALGLPVCFFRNLRSDPVSTGVYAPNERDLVPPGLRAMTRSEQADILSRVAPTSVFQALLELNSAFDKPPPSR